MWRPLFHDLIFNEVGERVELVRVGAISHYAIPDAGFLRHVEAEYVDRQVIAWMKQRFVAMRDTIVDGVAHMMGEENLFTRATVEHTIENIDRVLATGNVDLDQLRTTLWMMKFRVVVDVHGDVVEIDASGLSEPPGEF
jgi:hypothetical protein